MPTQTRRLPTIRQTIKGQKNGLMPFFYALNVLREVVNKLRRSQVFLARCIPNVATHCRNCLCLRKNSAQYQTIRKTFFQRTSDFKSKENYKRNFLPLKGRRQKQIQKSDLLFCKTTKMQCEKRKMPMQ